MKPDPFSSHPDRRALVAWIALSFALAAIFVSGGLLLRFHEASFGGGPNTVPGLLERIDRLGELHAAYGVYPPFTMEDPSTRAVSGLSVDLIQEIAKQLGVRVVWHRLNWNTMAADLKRGEYDVIADPIFQTIPRAREFAFSEPYSYFADGVGVVGINEKRFATLADVDAPNVTVAVGQGWASETLLRARFSNARILAVDTSTDLLQVFNEVLAGRADIAIADGGNARRFVDQHSGRAKALWLDDPPAFMPAGFALRPDDSRGATFLTVAILNLRSTGVLDSIAARYGLEDLALRVSP